ncbi:hypothetical protein SAMD00019534_007320 [Acytostelium subglobosum LB1]|uniref:hypothetical protein n=1 Tax=Acytostelium subglobosum LB1 TaxID=1410327 RepID=UPI0006448626|nr:hypothetical protein SAMD00019534_007320 [Acytostelium subglobosum LB1]GAM17557.1 hypothetical protein SAMD00019534_007320 [Acytostelium subglobosum LB1]|eukprot:XP_012759619.1 hypothetical protein SAMD00019534_007320 [Acytostelium subglobosum LB1]
MTSFDLANSTNSTNSDSSSGSSGLTTSTGSNNGVTGLSTSGGGGGGPSDRMTSSPKSSSQSGSPSNNEDSYYSMAKIYLNNRPNHMTNQQNLGRIEFNMKSEDLDQSWFHKEATRDVSIALLTSKPIVSTS